MFRLEWNQLVLQRRQRQRLPCGVCVVVVGGGVKGQKKDEQPQKKKVVDRLDIKRTEA